MPVLKILLPVLRRLVAWLPCLLREAFFFHLITWTHLSGVILDFLSSAFKQQLFFART
jgi:hypothetical protein